MSLTLYVDGASRGNPGKGGLGVFGFSTSKKQPLLQEGAFFGHVTNNVAEYAALAYALFLVKEHKLTSTLTIYADSELLVKQINGIYKVKNETLARWHRLIMLLAYPFDMKISHVRREKNKEADLLANKGVDTKIPPHASFIALLKRHNLVPDRLLS